MRIFTGIKYRMLKKKETNCVLCSDGNSFACIKLQILIPHLCVFAYASLGQKCHEILCHKSDKDVALSSYDTSCGESICAAGGTSCGTLSTQSYQHQENCGFGAVRIKQSSLLIWYSDFL